MSQIAASYLATLPEVETVRMPTGTLFVANGLIYQVVETTGGGFAKARQWRRDESTDVALVPGSFLTKTLPLVKTGRILPVYRSRVELSDNGKPTGFMLPSESLAKDAAYLDTALIKSTGAYVRNHHQEPAFAATDGTQNGLQYPTKRVSKARTARTIPVGSGTCATNRPLEPSWPSERTLW